VVDPVDVGADVEVPLRADEVGALDGDLLAVLLDLGGEQGAVEDGGVEDGALEDGAVELDSVEDGALEDGAVEDGTVEDGTVEDRTIEDQPLEDHTVQHRALQHGAVQHLGVVLGLAHTGGLGTAVGALITRAPETQHRGHQEHAI
jgi:hypothetical protein